VVTPGERGRFVEHRGARILVADYSEIESPAEVLGHMARVQAMIEAEPPGSIRYFLDVRGSRVTRELIAAFKEYGARSKPYFHASAVVGLSTVTMAAYRMLASLLAIDTRAFDSRDDAMDWLAAQ
jgi:hypothetical protein